MAYRRLPNTDNARLLAVIKLNEMLLKEDSVLKKYSEKIISNKKRFESLIQKRDAFKETRRGLTKEKKALLLRLKVYVSHFLQVFNFAIDRGDIEKECRVLFELGTSTGVIPSLLKENDIIEWARHIVVGEGKRISKGADRFSHPNYIQIQKITEEAEKVMSDLKTLEGNVQAYQAEIIKERIKIDAFIRKIWNEIEFQFVNETIAIKRIKAARYGVVYVA